MSIGDFGESAYIWRIYLKLSSPAIWAVLLFSYAFLADEPPAFQRALDMTSHPKTFTELRSIFGLCDVYRRIIRRFTDISARYAAFLREKTP